MGFELYEELSGLVSELDTSVRMLRQTGRDFALAYQSYRIELAKELLVLKAEGMPATLTKDVARGKPHVAKAKFEEISKEAIYKANQESVMSTKLKIRLIEAQINREYGGLQHG